MEAKIKEMEQIGDNTWMDCLYLNEASAPHLHKTAPPVHIADASCRPPQANDALSECRYALQHTYVYSYYLPAADDGGGNYKDHFEMQQMELERQTEEARPRPTPLAPRRRLTPCRARAARGAARARRQGHQPHGGGALLPDGQEAPAQPRRAVRQRGGRARRAARRGSGEQRGRQQQRRAVRRWAASLHKRRAPLEVALEVRQDTRQTPWPFRMPSIPRAQPSKGAAVAPYRQGLAPVARGGRFLFSFGIIRHNTTAQVPCV